MSDMIWLGLTRGYGSAEWPEENAPEQERNERVANYIRDFTGGWLTCGLLMILIYVSLRPVKMDESNMAERVLLVLVAVLPIVLFVAVAIVAASVAAATGLFRCALGQAPSGFVPRNVVA